ncbi:hypothetical protein CPter91_0700 [Collimonas pratensis]|uniref:Uncharacterized protein n=1 Tax=Collimonas pratensis TaxID=279113 RepID=A0A127PZR8_9BURK|nr:hypothetical protein CPter91_0700 [Collimonas pratensis]
MDSSSLSAGTLPINSLQLFNYRAAAGSGPDSIFCHRH